MALMVLSSWNSLKKESHDRGRILDTLKGISKGGEKMQVRSKVWLIKDKKPIMGTGRALLLNLILHKGSIAAAAQEMGMSYRTAWGNIKTMEKRLGYSLVNSRTGGGGGGSTLLTEEGKSLLQKYDSLMTTVEELADSNFLELFQQDRESGENRPS